MTGGPRDARGGILAPVAVVVLALAIGVGGGYAAGVLTEPTAGHTDTLPLQAASPSVPFTPYSPDIVYPSWQPDLDYRKKVIGSGDFAWRYLVPKGWTSSQSSINEFKWGVPGHPSGSYGYRIELVLGDHETPAGKVAAKLEAFRSIASYADVRVLLQTSDTLALTYRSKAENWLRYNTFRWFAQPGSSTAAVEISVNGRAQDQAGMTDLLETVAAALEPR